MEIHNITFDSGDPQLVARFWSEVVERPVAPWSNDDMAMIEGSPNLLFIKVPEGKVAKNRVHIDVHTDSMNGVRERIEGLGATFVHEQREHGVHWLTFQDPEGNELCVGTPLEGHAAPE